MGQFSIQVFLTQIRMSVKVNNRHLREMAVDSETGVGTSGGEYRYVELSPRMTHTIEALQKAGLLTNEMLAAWNEDYDAAVPATVQRG